MRGFEVRRLIYKRKLVDLVKSNPDIDETKVIALLSSQTGLSHSRIRIYLEELKAEGLL